MAKIEITKMNYEAMDSFGNKISELANEIDQSLGAIHNEFRRLSDSSSFAGSTLKAVNEALNPVLKVRETIWTRANSAQNAIKTSLEEVKQSEMENEAKLTEMLNLDPMSFEIPAEFNISTDQQA